MAMNRRAFLQRVCGGLVATAVVTKIPTAWIPEKVQVYAACEFLRKAFNRHVAARVESGAEFFDAVPHHMTAGRELYEAYESELTPNMRFMSGDPRDRARPNLAFKGVRLYKEGRGWRVECHADL
jgi:hypothetical protein